MNKLVINNETINYEQINENENLKELVFLNCSVIIDNIKLYNITKLKFNKCKFPILPKTLNQYINLQSLTLKHCYISNIPKIDKLIKLKKLNISNNNLTHFPSDIYNLTNLESLKYLSHKIINPTNKIAQLIKLIYLNKIKLMKTNIGRNGDLISRIYLEPSLTKHENNYYIYNNKMMIINMSLFKETIENINYLNIIDASKCNLSNLPTCIEYLQISNVDTIPTNLPCCLKVLILNNCSININEIKVPLTIYSKPLA